MKTLSHPISCKLSVTALLIALGGCGGSSIITSTATTIGVGIGQHPANGTVDATLGYKRAEFAYVPTDRGAVANTGGAEKTGNVILELSYGGFKDSPIYQRLAVGNEAVKQDGAQLMFARDENGNLGAEQLSTLQNVRAIPTEIPEITRLKLSMIRAYKRDATDTGLKAKYDAAANTAAQYADFDAFRKDVNSPSTKVNAVHAALIDAGVKLSK